MKIRTIILTALLAALCAAMPCAALAADGTAADYDEIDRMLAGDVRDNHIPGMAVAVVDKDGVLFERTYGNCDGAGRPFIIGSLINILLQFLL